MFLQFLPWSEARYIVTYITSGNNSRGDVYQSSINVLTTMVNQVRVINQPTFLHLLVQIFSASGFRAI